MSKMVSGHFSEKWRHSRTQKSVINTVISVTLSSLRHRKLSSKSRHKIFPF